jgi:hypothetical protein
MLNYNHFYWQLTKKYVTLFGNVFKDMQFFRYDNTHTTELERLIVPITYASKQKWMRIYQDPDLTKSTQVSLPRMSFELVSTVYDPPRKQNSLIRHPRSNTATQLDAQYMGVPYILYFDLYAFTKNIDDRDQIKEQILPAFNPDFTVMMTPIPEIGLVKDVKIKLESFDDDIENDFGPFDDPLRLITTTFHFSVPIYYYGPVNPVKIIRRVHANTFLDPSLKAGSIVRLNLANGNNGVYKTGETVFQGDSFDVATCMGTVDYFSNNRNYIRITGTQGSFTLNTAVRSTETNANYRATSFDVTPLKLVHIKIEPDPLDAEPTDDFGYTTTITEFPNIDV